MTEKPIYWTGHFLGCAPGRGGGSCSRSPPSWLCVPASTSRSSGLGGPTAGLMAAVGQGLSLPALEGGVICSSRSRRLLTGAAGLGGVGVGLRYLLLDLGGARRPIPWPLLCMSWVWFPCGLVMVSPWVLWGRRGLPIRRATALGQRSETCLWLRLEMRTLCLALKHPGGALG